MPTRRIPAAILRDFTVPEADPRPSQHGAQREDSIIASFLPGWSREASAAAKAAFLPGVAPVAEGNGRGRGATLIDAFRVNPARACGGDFLSMKAPRERKEGGFPSSVECFKGTRETLAAGLAAIRNNVGRGKAFPLAVVHGDGDKSVDHIWEWCLLDLGRVIENPRWFVADECWDTWGGVPVKPWNDHHRGAAGSPVSVWVSFLRREYVGMVGGTAKYRFPADPNGDYVSLNTTVSKRSGHRFITGSPEDFARDVDAATVLR